MDRAQQLSRALAELADTLVSDFDVAEFLHMLTERCVELVDAGAAGLLLADGRGNLRVMASSDERARTLELFEVQKQEGPCLDCYRTGEPVINQTLDEGSRWPTFSREARVAGFSSVHALPLRLRDQVIGALNLLSVKEAGLGETELTVSQVMADVATISLLQARALEHARVLVDQLQRALNSRVVIEQAKGILAERVDVDLDTAFRLLRAYARNHNKHLSGVARAVVEDALPTGVFTSPPPAATRPRP